MGSLDPCLLCGQIGCDVEHPYAPVMLHTIVGSWADQVLPPVTSEAALNGGGRMASVEQGMVPDEVVATLDALARELVVPVSELLWAMGEQWPEPAQIPARLQAPTEQLVRVFYALITHPMFQALGDLDS